MNETRPVRDGRAEEAFELTPPSTSQPTPGLVPDTPVDEAPYAQRPSYKPEEGPPDTASEVGSVVRAVLFGALVLALLAALITLWRY